MGVGGGNLGFFLGFSVLLFGVGLTPGEGGGRLDTWYLVGKWGRFRVKLFVGKELRGENGMFDFVRFLRFYALLLTRSGRKCSKRCTFYSILCTLGFWARIKGRKVKRFSANMFIRFGNEGKDEKIKHGLARIHTDFWGKRR